MPQFDWESLTKESLLKALKFYKPDNPPKRAASKESLIAEAKGFLLENKDKIDGFFRKIGDVKTEKDVQKAKADEEEGA
jgi:hypothetical protein